MYIVSVPFRLNLWKHHLCWVQAQLHQAINNPIHLNLRDKILENIKAINSNHVDVYVGNLSPDELIQNVNMKLHDLGITNRNIFLEWISIHDFRLITLLDNSVWIVRKGAEHEYYIHLHPARNSPNAIRLYGNSWKTAIVYSLLYPDHVNIDMIVINEIRQKILNLSPIKDMASCKRLQKAFEILNMHQQNLHTMQNI
jgi:hypothetical protein